MEKTPATLRGREPAFLASINRIASSKTHYAKFLAVEIRRRGAGFVRFAEGEGVDRIFASAAP